MMVNICTGSRAWRYSITVCGVRHRYPVAQTRLRFISWLGLCPSVQLVHPSTCLGCLRAFTTLTSAPSRVVPCLLDSSHQRHSGLLQASIPACCGPRQGPRRLVPLCARSQNCIARPPCVHCNTRKPAEGRATSILRGSQVPGVPYYAVRFLHRPTHAPDFKP